MSQGIAVKPIEEAVKPEPKDTAKLVEKMQADPIFSLAILTYQALASTVTVSVSYEGADQARGNMLAGHLQAIWERYLSPALQCIEYGRQAFEIVGGYGTSGLHGVQELVEIPFELSTPVKDRETKQYNEMTVGKGSSKVSVPIEELWMPTYQAKPLEPFGRSIYRGAPWKVYQWREKAQENYDTFIGRFSLGFGMATAPDEPVGGDLVGKGSLGEIDEQGQGIDPQVAMAQQLKRVASGGWLVLSSKQYKPEEGSGPLYNVVFGPELKDGTPLERLWATLDVMALRAMGIPERAVIQSAEVGSRAVADAHQIVLNNQVEGIIRQVAESFQSQVVDKVKSWNDLEGSLTVNWLPIGDATEEDTSEMVKEILKAPSLPPAAKLLDLKQMFEGSGFPLASNIDEEIEALKSAAPAPANQFASMFGPTPPISNGGRMNGYSG